MDQAPISVVIPIYHRRDSLHQTLAALAHQTLPPNAYEVVLACGGPADCVCDITAQASLPYRLRAVWRPQRGRSATRLYGLRAAVGALLVLLDDDLEPAPGLLAAHLLTQSEGVQQVVIGAVQRQSEAAQPIREAAAGNLSVPRTALRKAGLLDEASEAQADEADLLQRLRRAGCSVMYQAEALAYQHAERGTAATSPEPAGANSITTAPIRWHHAEPALHLAAVL